MSYDNLCKRLAEQYPQAFLRWLLGGTSSEIKLLKIELSNEPIRADFLSFFQLEDLAEALLEFNHWDELTHWLDNQSV